MLGCIRPAFGMSKQDLSTKLGGRSTGTSGDMQRDILANVHEPLDHNAKFLVRNLPSGKSRSSRRPDLTLTTSFSTMQRPANRVHSQQCRGLCIESIVLQQHCCAAVLASYNLSLTVLSTQLPLLHAAPGSLSGHLVRAGAVLDGCRCKSTHNVCEPRTISKPRAGEPADDLNGHLPDLERSIVQRQQERRGQLTLTFCNSSQCSVNRDIASR